MGINSRSEILKQMAGKSIMNGWGAITVFNRTRINRFLEQQYITRMEGYSFLPAFKGSVSLEDNSNASVQLDSIVLGKPLLSFVDEASLDDSYATVTMNIVSGNVLMMQPNERVSRVATSLRIRESQGYQLTLRIKLNVVAGSVNDQGLVVMDLKDGVEFLCNVLPDFLDQKSIGSAFKQYFESLPVYQRVFVLGMLDVSEYDPLSPKEFQILTQRAPGAEKLAASNYGDGGVVVFIRVGADKEKGVLPTEGSGFPYLIPDDEDAEGNIYSAAIVVSEKWKQYVGDQQIAKLSSLLFPGADVFESKDTATPYDYINFGNVDPASTQLSIEPSIVNLQAGESQAFKLIDAKGNTVSGVVWTAKSLSSHTKEGDGSISAEGVYTAAQQNHIGLDCVRVVVTGKVTNGDDVFTVSASVTVSTDGMVIAPQLSTRIIEDKPRPVMLSVTSSADSNLTWSMSLPDVGTLVCPTPNTAIYTPPNQEQENFETVQVIQVYDATTKQYASSTVVLFNDYLLNKVLPDNVRHLKPSGTQAFVIDDDSEVGTKTWTVISGQGEFKDPSSGVFTAPDTVNESVTVVKCEWTYQGITLPYYSTVELDRFEDQPTWSDLSTFSVRVRNDDQGFSSVGFAYRNGLQQIKLAVVIETKKVGQESIRLSAEEIQTLRLRFSNKSEVTPLLPEQSGIPPGSTVTWATHNIRNSVHSYPGPGLASAEALLPAPLDEESTVRPELYVHTTAHENSGDTFFLSFVGGSLGKTWYSTDLNKELGQVNLSSREIPKIEDNGFTFKSREISDGTRVASVISRSDSSTHTSRAGEVEPEPEPGTSYDYKLNTIRYYQLALIGRKISALKFTTDPEDQKLSAEGFGRKSTIRWESRQKEETMFSFTGFAWNPLTLKGIPQGELVSRDLQFDPDLELLVTKPGALTIPVDDNIPQGCIVFSMHRTDDVRYGDVVGPDKIKVREDLYKNVFANVMDEYGSWYVLVISFPSENVHNREQLSPAFQHYSV